MLAAQSVQPKDLDVVKVLLKADITQLDTIVQNGVRMLVWVQESQNCHICLCETRVRGQ